MLDSGRLGRFGRAIGFSLGIVWPIEPPGAWSTCSYVVYSFSLLLFYSLIRLANSLIHRKISYFSLKFSVY